MIILHYGCLFYLVMGESSIFICAATIDIRYQRVVVGCIVIQVSDFITNGLSRPCKPDLTASVVSREVG